MLNGDMLRVIASYTGVFEMIMVCKSWRKAIVKEVRNVENVREGTKWNIAGAEVMVRKVYLREQNDKWIKDNFVTSCHRYGEGKRRLCLGIKWENTFIIGEVLDPENYEKCRDVAARILGVPKTMEYLKVLCNPAPSLSLGINRDGKICVWDSVFVLFELERSLF